MPFARKQTRPNWKPFNTIKLGNAINLDSKPLSHCCLRIVFASRSPQLRYRARISNPSSPTPRIFSPIERDFECRPANRISRSFSSRTTASRSEIVGSVVCSSVWGNKKLKITDVEWTNDACFFNEINNVDEIDSTYNRWLYPREYAAGKEDRRRARQSAWIYHEPRDRNNRSSLIGICSCWCWKNLRIQYQPSSTLVPDKWTSCLRKPHPRVTIPIDSRNTNFGAEYTR